MQLNSFAAWHGCGGWPLNVLVCLHAPKTRSSQNHKGSMMYSTSDYGTSEQFANAHQSKRNSLHKPVYMATLTCYHLRPWVCAHRVAVLPGESLCQAGHQGSR